MISAPPDALPLEDGSFDFALCRSLARVSDPAAVCREMMRVAKRGFIETPSLLNALLDADPADRWVITLERLPEQEPTLVFQRRAFVRPPFRHALRGKWHQDATFRFAWEYGYRNVTHIQFAWEGSFRFRVEDRPDAYDYDDPMQSAEAYLNRTLQGLRFGSIPPLALLSDAERAVALQPQNAIAHNALGCALWLQRREPEALVAFAEASRLAPHVAGYRQNARSIPGMNPQLHLEMLAPERDEREDIAENFGGKVYYAFVNYDDRLAQDIGIRPQDRVLDVGGGQRPLKRADASIDFDVFEGAHRQGLAINRDKPLFCGDVQALPFADGAFDVACCRMVLEHVLDPAAACKEIQRVAKRGFLETPNIFWECFYGHPTHRWLIEWEEATRTLVFQRKPFDSIPFQSAIVPLLYTQRDVQRAFEVTFRNLATTQIDWDEDRPFSVRVVGDTPEAAYDYMGRPEDATRGSMNYAKDLLAGGLAPVAVAEADDALKIAPTPELKEEALRLRLEIATAMGDQTKIGEIRTQLRQSMGGGSAPLSLSQGSPAPSPLLWTAPLLDPSGYADEARHFLFALHAAGANVAARELRWSQKFAVLTREREQILQSLLRTPIADSHVRVWHILPSAFQRDPQAKVNIGRTMFETDRLPAAWVSACNQMDVLWVPGEFNRQTFAFAGVRPEKLRVVPGTIDLRPYHPSCAPLQIEGARGYNFLSLFDWTLRKGWDVLIRAFVEEFDQDDDVSLIIKTHSSMGYSTQQIVDNVAKYLTEERGCDLNRIPMIIFQDANIPDERMPNLYRAAQCFVLPTRGEGWGRPIMEAMAMGLPVIATYWSGQTAFMTPENSLPLDYEVQDVPEVAWREIPTFQGHRWAEPSVSHLRQRMRQAFEDRAGGKAIGNRARAHLEQHFTYPAVAKTLLAELQRLGVSL